MNTTSPASADDTRSSLLARAKNQDADAWMRLVQWIGPFILRWCRRAGLQSADCEEVSQEVLKDAWRGLGAFRKERPGHSFRGWVYIITRNRIRDLLAQRSPALPLPPDLPAEAERSEAHDLKESALRLVIQDVIAHHAGDGGFRAFYRTAVDGLTAGQAALELGMSADVVRQHKSRWLKRLRDELREQFGDLLD